MKIISCNVRGLHRPFKRHLVKYFLLSIETNIVFIQEFKLQDIHRSVWNEIGGRFLDSFEIIPATGTSGGIIMACDSSKISGSLIHSKVFSLTLEFTSRLDILTWICMTVYGTNSRSLWTNFLNEIDYVRSLSYTTWVLCGDFNTVFSLNDKNRCFPNLGDFALAQNLLDDFSLLNPPLHGRGFTWTNGQANPIWTSLADSYSHTIGPLFFLEQVNLLCLDLVPITPL